MRLEHRLKALERPFMADDGQRVTAIKVEFFAPGDTYPVSRGIGVAHILPGRSQAGSSMFRDKGEAPDAFIARVDAEHIRVHGEPLSAGG